MLPGNVHECRLLPDGTVMAVCSGIRGIPGGGYLHGPRVGKGTLVHFDIQQGRILDKKQVGDDSQILGHSYRTKEGTTLVIGRPRPDTPQNGRIYFSPDGDAPFHALKGSTDLPGGVPGECLSLAVNEESHRAIVTNPENQTLFVIDTREGAFVKAIPCYAQGVAFDSQSGRFIASGNTLSLLDGKGERFENWSDPSFEKRLPERFTSAHSLLI